MQQILQKTKSKIGMFLITLFLMTSAWMIVPPPSRAGDRTGVVTIYPAFHVRHQRTFGLGVAVGTAIGSGSLDVSAGTGMISKAGAIALIVAVAR